MTLTAQGWFLDPYEVHEARYYSEGQPTKLVRDGDSESYDAPPDTPPSAGDLVPVPVADGVGDGDDLHRADEASTTPYDAKTARRAALDVFDQSAGQF